ncbi:MAG: hypothetical protein WAO71_16030 [Gallionella sp.]
MNILQKFYTRSLPTPKSTTTDYRLPTTDYRLPITDYRLPITDYRLPTIIFPLQ